jgi:hypothetical protein
MIKACRKMGHSRSTRRSWAVRLNRSHGGSARADSDSEAAKQMNAALILLGIVSFAFALSAFRLVADAYAAISHFFCCRVADRIADDRCPRTVVAEIHISPRGRPYGAVRPASAPAHLCRVIHLVRRVTKEGFSCAEGGDGRPKRRFKDGACDKRLPRRRSQAKPPGGACLRRPARYVVPAYPRSPSPANPRTPLREHRRPKRSADHADRLRQRGLPNTPAGSEARTTMSFREVPDRPGGPFLRFHR